MDHYLDPKYLARVAQMELLNPPAFRFLSRLQDSGLDHGLWLSTTTNVHIYKGQAFLMYVKLQGPKPEPTSVVLSPDYNNMIAQDATDQSRLLFPRAVEKMIMARRGFSTHWARRTPRGDMVIKPSAPDAFFEALFDQLRDLDTVEPEQLPSGS